MLSDVFVVEVPANHFFDVTDHSFLVFGLLAYSDFIIFAYAN